MMISQAISSGLRAAWRAKWMVLIFFACNLLLAAAIAAPMQTAIADHLGNSAVGEQLARGFDSAWLGEFQVAYSTFMRAFSIAIVYGAILFLALNTVLSAGAFEVFAQAGGAGMHAFGRGIGKYFLRFSRLVIVASFFYFVAFWLWQGPVSYGLDALFRDSAVERWHFYLNWVRWAALFFTVFVINMVVDYAKADLVIDDHRSVLAALGHAAGFVVAHFGRVFAIYLALGLMATVTVFVYSAFARFFPQSSMITVLIWFLVAQALLCARWMFRLASWGAAVAFYGGHKMSTSEEQGAPEVVQA
jgi:hypothetical protein